MCRAFGVHFFWPTLYISGNLPSLNDRVTSRVISSANVSAHVFSTEVGMLSRGEDFAGIDLMTVGTSLNVGGSYIVREYVFLRFFEAAFKKT